SKEVREEDRDQKGLTLVGLCSSPSSVETRARKAESYRFARWNSAPAKLSAAAYFADDRRPLTPGRPRQPRCASGPTCDPQGCGAQQCEAQPPSPMRGLDR